MRRPAPPLPLPRTASSPRPSSWTSSICSATGGRVRVVVINAGNANCAAGQPGLNAARATCAAAARVFDCRAEEVFPSFDGNHWRPLPAEKLIAVLPVLAASLGTDPATSTRLRRPSYHRYRGEDRLRAAGPGGARWRCPGGPHCRLRQRRRHDLPAACASRNDVDLHSD